METGHRGGGGGGGGLLPGEETFADGGLSEGRGRFAGDLAALGGQHGQWGSSKRLRVLRQDTHTNTIIIEP